MLETKFRFNQLLVGFAWNWPTS